MFQELSSLYQQLGSAHQHLIIIVIVEDHLEVLSSSALISIQHGEAGQGGENMKNRLFSVNVSRSFQSNPLNRPVKKVDSIPPEVR